MTARSAREYRMTNTPLRSARAAPPARADLDVMLSPEPERACQCSAAAVTDVERACRLASILLGLALPGQRPGAAPSLILVLRVERHGIPDGLAGDVEHHLRWRGELPLPRERAL